MNKKQALSMLAFIADLYTVIQAPEVDPATVTAAPDSNGKAKESRPMTVPAG